MMFFLIDPVTLIFLLLLILTWYMYFNVAKQVFVFTISILVLYVLFASPMLANGLTLLLEGYESSKNCKSSVKVIVVLGGGIRGGNNHNTYEIENLHEASFRRTQGSLILLEQYPMLKIIVSGGAGSGKVKEADLMAALLIKQGIKSNKIIKENKSTNTWESALNTSVILKSKNINSIYLVTSALHMRRASLAYKKIGLEVCTYYVDRTFIEPAWPGMLIPQTSALVKTKKALHEIIGLVWYYVIGKI